MDLIRTIFFIKKTNFKSRITILCFVKTDGLVKSRIWQICNSTEGKNLIFFNILYNQDFSYSFEMTILQDFLRAHQN